MDSKFKLDLNTYAKLVTRVVLPAFIFYSMYLYRPDAATALLLPAGIALLLTDSAAAYLLATALGFTGDEKNTFRALSTLSNAGQIGIAPVSYTHLDVYKRQVIWRSSAQMPALIFTARERMARLSVSFPPRPFPSMRKMCIRDSFWLFLLFYTVRFLCVPLCLL